ncbi:hypothetical protein ACFLZ9_00010 [Patescibacteria group bacterium]
MENLEFSAQDKNQGTQDKNNLINHDQKYTKTHRKLIIAIIVLGLLAIGFGSAWAYERILQKIGECVPGASGICFDVIEKGDPAGKMREIKIKNLDENKKYRLVVIKEDGDKEIEVGETIIDLSQKCYDSDGGKNYYKQGTLEWPVQDFRAQDTCRGEELLEYFCVEGRYDEIGFDCPYGCTNGACNRVPGTSPPANPTCYDTDNGQNFFVSGAARGEFNGDYDSYNDYCDPASVQVVEYYCAAGKVEVTYHTCPNGCVGGKCNHELDNCTDSDGGRNYFSKGHTSWPVQSFEFDDVCQDANTLQEGYCTLGGGMTQTYNCLNGCNIPDGVCHKAQYGQRCEADNECDDPTVLILECKPSGRYPDMEKYCCGVNQCASVIPGTAPPIVNCVDEGGTDQIHDGSTVICHNGEYQ